MDFLAKAKEYNTWSGDDAIDFFNFKIKFRFPKIIYCLLNQNVKIWNPKIVI